MRRKVTVETLNGKLFLPALSPRPYPDALPDVTRIEYNALTKDGTDGHRTFVLKRTCHATTKPPVPMYSTGCSVCGAVWDFFYNICGYKGPPSFCPRCGSRVVSADDDL